MKTAVVCAAFDEATDAAIAELRAQLRALGAKAPVDPSHRPHFTLTAATVTDEEVARVSAAAAEVAARHSAIPLVLDRIGSFGRGSIIWVGPAPSEPLSALQRDAYATLRAARYKPAFGRQSVPKFWTAHCTLARRAERSIAPRLREQFVPVPATVTALATVLVNGRGDVALSQLTGPTSATP